MQSNLVFNYILIGYNNNKICNKFYLTKSTSILDFLIMQAKKSIQGQWFYLPKKNKCLLAVMKSSKVVFQIQFLNRFNKNNKYYEYYKTTGGYFSHGSICSFVAQLQCFGFRYVSIFCSYFKITIDHFKSN